MGTLRAGAAKIDMTPPVGIELAGYGYRVRGTQRSTGINDRLWIRALAIGDGESTALLLVLDLLGIELPTTQKIRRLIAAQHDVRPSDVLLCCTHTHSAPSIFEQHEPDIAVDEEWKDSVIGSAVSVAGSALAKMTAARVAAGSIEVKGVGANRKAILDDGSIFHYVGLSARQPPPGRTVTEKGPIDPWVSALCLRDQSDRIVAAIVNYACHPWLYNGSRISSEVAGACAQSLEERIRAKSPDAIALYVPGTGSNIITLQHQTPMPDGIQAQERWFALERVRMGGILAHAALQIIETRTEYSDLASIRAQVCPLIAPVYDRPLREVLDRHSHLPPTDLQMQTEMHVLSLGDILLVGLPSEVYVEYGLEIKRRSHSAHTMVLSYCNDYFADIITHQAVAEGHCPELDWTHVHPDVRDRILACLEQRGHLRA